MVVKILFCLILTAMAAVMDGQTLGGPMHGKVVVCYVANWAPYRPPPGAFTLEDLDPSLCTHLVYAFATLDESTMSIKSHDPWQDLEKDYGKAGYKRAVALKDRYPHLKVTIAIGGWNEGSAKYSRMAAEEGTRRRFIESVLEFLKTYRFDGLDLDWEYPARRDGRPQDKENFVALVRELKEAFQPHGYILTAALGAGKETMDAAYDLTRLSRYLDLIHMMCYDYHGTWDGYVGANAPLRGSSELDVLSVEYTIKYMLSHGVSPYKMVMGLPMYGRTFVLQDPSVGQVQFGHTPAQSQGFPGPLTKENGFMGYNEICMELANQSSWTYHWHEQSATPYLRDGARVISYDDGRSIASKVKMAVEYGLGGLMVWSVDTDDFRGLQSPQPQPPHAPRDTYTDFVAQYDRMVKDPVLHKAMRNLNLPEAAHHLGKRSHYTTSNGRLQLRLPEPQQPNYHLMRTINDATTLAMEEKRITDEMNRVMRENEIDHGKDGGWSMGNNLMVMFMCVLVAL